MSIEEKEKRKEDSAKKYWEDRHKIIDGIDHKKCSKCFEYLPSNSEYFYKNSANKSDGLFPDCKECTKKRVTKWIKDNPEQNAIHQLTYRTKPDKRRLRKDLMTKYRNQGVILRWQRTHRDRLAEYGKESRARKHIVSNKEWKYCKEYFNYSCAYCEMPEEDHKILFNQQLHREHVAHDGSVYLDNCIPSCLPCNSSKSQGDMKQWFEVINSDNFTEERYNKIIKWLSEDYKEYFEGFREKRTRKTK